MSEAGAMAQFEATAGLAVRGASTVPGAVEARRRLTEAGVPGLLVETVKGQMAASQGSEGEGK
jgi:hypothetical protein